MKYRRDTNLFKDLLKNLHLGRGEAFGKQFLVVSKNTRPNASPLERLGDRLDSNIF